MDIDARFDRIEEKIDRLSEKIVTVEIVQKLDRDYHRARKNAIYQTAIIALSIVMSAIAIYRVI